MLPYGHRTTVTKEAKRAPYSLVGVLEDGASLPDEALEVCHPSGALASGQVSKSTLVMSGDGAFRVQYVMASTRVSDTHREGSQREHHQ